MDTVANETNNLIGGYEEFAALAGLIGDDVTAAAQITDYDLAHQTTALFLTECFVEEALAKLGYEAKFDASTGRRSRYAYVDINGEDDDDSRIWCIRISDHMEAHPPRDCERQFSIAPGEMTALRVIEKFAAEKAALNI